MESDSKSKGEYVALNDLPNVEVHEEEIGSFEDNFPLHHSAQFGKVDRLKELLGEGNHSIFAKDLTGRTPLHWAASGKNHKQGFRCVKALLASPQLGEDTKEKVAYIDTQSNNGETAVHRAASNESKKITEYLLQAGGNATVRSRCGIEPKHLIMEIIPETMVLLCNNSIKVAKGEPADKDLEVALDFGSIVGAFGRRLQSNLREGEATEDYVRELPVESEFLKYALNRRRTNKHCKEIITHPLVQIFLHLKWKKIWILFYLSIQYHIIWLILYTRFIVDVYLISCPYISPGENSSGNSSQVKRVLRHARGGGASNDPSPSDSSEPQQTRFSWLGELFSDVNDNQELTCDLNQVNMMTAYTVLFITLVFAIKEIFEFCKAQKKIKDYFLQMENIGQWLVIASVLLTSWPVFSSDNNMPEWQYSISAFGIFLAWSLILSQIGKLPKLGIYVEMLVKVLKGFALFIMTFASLLVAFALSLSVLIPGKPAFSSLPLALLKVLMMMIGELNYDEVFHGDEAITPFPVAAHIIFATFAIMVTIILINLLIGVTVSDIQGLKHDAEVSALLAKLERIHFMESFLLSDMVQKCLGFCKCTASWKSFPLVTNPLDDDGMTVTKSIQEIPKELEEEVRRLAAANMPEEVQDVVDQKKEKFKNFLKSHDYI